MHQFVASANLGWVLLAFFVGLGTRLSAIAIWTATEPDPCPHNGCTRQKVHTRLCPDGHPLRPNFHNKAKKSVLKKQAATLPLGE